MELDVLLVQKQMGLKTEWRAGTEISEGEGGENAVRNGLQNNILAMLDQR